MSPRKSLTPEKRKGYKGVAIPVFCQNVQKRRLELGIKQEELAKLIGASKPRISELEGGKFPRSEDRIIALARALKTTPDVLLGFTEE